MFKDCCASRRVNCGDSDGSSSSSAGSSAGVPLQSEQGADTSVVLLLTSSRHGMGSPFTAAISPGAGAGREHWGRHLLPQWNELIPFTGTRGQLVPSCPTHSVCEVTIATLYGLALIDLEGPVCFYFKHTVHIMKHFKPCVSCIPY